MFCLVSTRPVTLSSVKPSVCCLFAIHRAVAALILHMPVCFMCAKWYVHCVEHLHAEAEASRRMLPPLASSLAYSNYTQWRSSHSEEGVDLPEVTPGVSLTDLYRAAEREVRTGLCWAAERDCGLQLCQLKREQQCCV